MEILNKAISVPTEHQSGRIATHALIVGHLSGATTWTQQSRKAWEDTEACKYYSIPRERRGLTGHFLHVLPAHRCDRVVLVEVFTFDGPADHA